MVPTTHLRRPWLAALLLALAGHAAAHDTWFAPLPPGPQGEPLLALGTGERFPQQQTPLDKDLVQASGCQAPGAADPQAGAPLRWVAYRPEAVVLRPDAPTSAGTRLSCWLQAQPLTIALDDATVDSYLDEIRAQPTVRARWATQRARGVRWQERYTKHARIELPGAVPGVAGQAGQAGGAPALDLQADMPAGPLRAGDRLRVQLLRDGRPLAGLPLVLRNDLSPLALWQQTDAEGWVSLRLPLAARWLLSAVDLRPADMQRDPQAGPQADTWDSRFVSLTIETLARR